MFGAKNEKEIRWERRLDMFNFCVNGGHAKTNQENCCIVTYFCTSDPVQIFLLRRSFLDLISFSGTVSIYVSGVSLCQDKYTNASDPVVTREQRMKEQAWHYFAAVSEVMLYVFAGWKVEAGQWFKSNKQLDLQTVKLLLLKTLGKEQSIDTAGPCWWNKRWCQRTCRALLAIWRRQDLTPKHCCMCRVFRLNHIFWFFLVIISFGFGWAVGW